MEVVKELSDKNYTKFMEATNSVVFIDFYSDTCGSYQVLAKDGFFSKLFR